jgi:hypothetical protein
VSKSAIVVQITFLLVFLVYWYTGLLDPWKVPFDTWLRANALEIFAFAGVLVVYNYLAVITRQLENLLDIAEHQERTNQRLAKIIEHLRAD